MKKLIYLLMTALLPCLYSCEKELPAPAISALLVPSGCNWAPCDQAIAKTKQACQALANSLCDTILVDITCCQDGAEAYALVIVFPDYRKCGVIPSNFNLSEIIANSH